MTNEPVLSLEPAKEVKVEPSQILDDYNLDERQVMLAQLLAMGQKSSEIASVLDRSEGWVRQHKKNSEVQKLTRELQNEAVESAKKIVNFNTVQAANTMVGLLDSPDQRIKFSAAKDLLDRGVSKPFPESPGGNNTFNYYNFQNMESGELKVMIQERYKAVMED